MQIFSLDHSQAAPVDARGAVLALGNFDGVHRGHAHVLVQARALSRDLSAPLGVLTFTPHPRRFFRPDEPAFALASDRQRHDLLAMLGLELCVEMGFDARLAGLSAERFVDEVLVERLGVAGIAVGEDFRFGAERAGDIATLRRAEAAGKFRVLTPQLLSLDGAPVSSSRVRQELAAGRVDAAAGLLGRVWTVEAVVEPGDRRGRTIGFPTANLRLGPLMHPAFGVYAIRATVLTGPEAGLVRDGVANFGRRPTFALPEPLLEAHLFDYAGDLYGQALSVGLHRFIRGERKFSGLPELKAQIEADSAAARAALA